MTAPKKLKRRPSAHCSYVWRYLPMLWTDKLAAQWWRGPGENMLVLCLPGYHLAGFTFSRS